MGYNDDNTLKMIQIIFQNGKGGNIQVIGRFIQNQHVGGFHQHPEQNQPPLFSAGQFSKWGILGRPEKQKSLQHL